MEEVTVVKKGRVLEILLNRPKVNAIDLATSRKLGEAFVLLRDDPELWVGILTAAGDRIFFCRLGSQVTESGRYVLR